MSAIASPTSTTPAARSAIAAARPGRGAGTFFPGVVAGFGVTVALWIAWWFTHLPPSVLDWSAAFPLLLAVMFVGFVWSTRGLGARGWAVGLVAGLTAAVLSFLILGSRLVEQPETTAEFAAYANRLRPSAALTYGGFLVASGALGLVGGAIGGTLGRRAEPDAGVWLGRFAVITAASFFPLILVGGTVTSADAGMAVPDAVTTYGAVSFFFPLSLMSEPRIFLEHTHRLFGTLVGVTTIALMVATMAVHRRHWKSGLAAAVPLALGTFAVAALGQVSGGGRPVLPPEAVRTVAILAWLGAFAWAAASLWLRRPAWSAAALFALVTIQGVLGIVRVDQNIALWATLHGVSGQIVLGVGVGVAVVLAPLFRRDPADAPLTSRAAARAAQAWMFVLLGALLVQLTLGATYRHLASENPGTGHAALWGHVAFSIVVAVAAVTSGFLARRAEGFSAQGRTLRRIGAWLVACVFVQFVLGFLALGHASPTRVPMPGELGEAPAIGVLSTAITTAHQSNGAVLLALAALGIGWTARLRARPAAATAGN